MKALLHGSYFGYNFGDTLLVRLFCDWLKAAAPDVEVQLPLANRRNTQLIGADRRGLLGLGEAKLMLLSGGGYLGEPRKRKTKWTLRAYKRHMLLINALRDRMPVTPLAVGVGPLSSARMRRDVVRLFEEAEQPVVRDETSARYLREWGVQREVTVSTDAVVTASRDELVRGASPAPAALAELRRRHGTVIGIHTEVHPSAGDLALAQGMLRWFLDNTDYGVVLFSDGAPLIASSAWTDKVQVPEAQAARVAKIRYSGQPEDLIGLLAELDLVVTTKLHVGIVRCALERAVIAAPAHSKTPRFYDQMDLSDWCVPHDSTRRVEEAAERVRRWIDGARPDLGAFAVRRAEGYYRDRVASLVRAAAAR